MDFMERRAQWLSSLAVLLLLLLSACDGNNNKWGKPVEKWYDNGQLMERRYYENGKKVGVHLGWWPNGNKRFEYHYSMDMYDGPVKEWYEDGQLYRSFNYKDGQEFGAQQMWKPDGRISANYEVRDGRKYGLTGVKNCISVWNDETGEISSDD